MNFHDNLNLDKSNSGKPTYILHSIQFGKTRFRLKSTIKVHPDDWNLRSQEVRRSDSNYLEKNSTLTDQKADIEKLFLRAQLLGVTLTKEYFIKNLPFAKDLITEAKFVDIFNEYIKIITPKKSNTTVKLFKTTLKHIENFEADNNMYINFESIDFKFYDLFTNYLLSDKNLVDNTVGKYIKKLKTFLSWASKMNYNTKEDYKKFKVIDKAGQIFPLTLDEYDLLAKAKVPVRLDRIRDLFLIECYTGLRYSDIQKLKPEHILNDSIVITTKKTKDNLFIPLTNSPMKILDKYFNHGNDDLAKELPQITNQKMNDYLKELCLAARIDTPCLKITFRGSRRDEKSYPKHQLVTTHTGRQSFITNSLLLGVQAQVVMDIVGHKSYSTFKRYIKFTSQQLKNEMKAWEKH